MKEWGDLLQRVTPTQLLHSKDKMGKQVRDKHRALPYKVFLSTESIWHDALHPVSVCTDGNELSDPALHKAKTRCHITLFVTYFHPKSGHDGMTDMKKCEHACTHTYARARTHTDTLTALKKHKK